MDNPLINDQKQTLLIVTEDNLLAIAEIAAARILQNKKSKWVTPEEAEKMLNLKRQSILKLWERLEIDLTWVGDEGTKKWLADRKSIEDYLERRRNFNGSKGTKNYKPRKKIKR